MPENAKNTAPPRLLRGWGQRGTAAATIAARLTFENISHAYGNVEVIRDLSLDIAPGEIICLLGASGSGKTTLLRIAAGIERQSAGRVLINQSEIAGPSRFLPPEQRGVGLMFQDYALFPHMNIMENVAYGLGRLLGPQAENEARAALRRVGLETYAGSFPHLLSGGEQQRVALARAIAPRPSVLMMDEPFSGLDRRLRDSVRDETLAVLRETRATCIIVTHDPEEAMRVADRIVLLRGGRAVQVGPARELYKAPLDLFVARFFSEFNEISAEIADGAAISPVGRFRAGALASGAAVNVCIRPQGVRINAPGAGIAGRVLRRRFLGDVDIVEVAVEGLDAPIKAHVPVLSAPAVGDEVAVSFDEEHVLVFLADQDDS